MNLSSSVIITFLSVTLVMVTSRPHPYPPPLPRYPRDDQMMAADNSYGSQPVSHKNFSMTIVTQTWPWCSINYNRNCRLVELKFKYTEVQAREKDTTYLPHGVTTILSQLIFKHIIKFLLIIKMSINFETLKKYMC